MERYFPKKPASCTQKCYELSICVAVPPSQLFVEAEFGWKISGALTMITWLRDCIMTVVIFAVTSSCCDITCKSVPDSPPPNLSVIRARGEPGNKASALFFIYFRKNFSVRKRQL